MHLVQSPPSYSLLHHHPIPGTALELERLLYFCATFEVHLLEVPDEEGPAHLA
jgi:hypothetical protein